MSEYRAPIRDMQFVLKELAGLEELAKLPGIGRKSAMRRFLPIRSSSPALSPFEVSMSRIAAMVRRACATEVPVTSSARIEVLATEIEHPVASYDTSVTTGPSAPCST